MARILAVCTGNVCRSPLVERLLAKELLADSRPGGAGAEPVIVGSAGTHAMVGHEMSPLAEAELAALGGDATGFTARQLTRELVAESDLILALTRAHRRQVVMMWPRATRIAFTLREFARLSDGLDLADAALAGTTGTAERLRALVPAAAMQRGIKAPTPGEDDDVLDPYGGTPAVYAQATQLMVPAIRHLIGLLRG